MIQILSTKKLKPNQRDLLLGSGFSVVDYDAIKITPLTTEVHSPIKNAIFTSQNCVHSIFEQHATTIQIDRCFCVGEKTANLLRENGQKMEFTALNSKKLAQFIAKNHKNEVFSYFCGSHRRDELPALLKSAEIDLFELKTYKTDLKPKKFHQKWAGILFFSPSGVASYVIENTPENKGKHEYIAFCIGETTADEAKKYFSNVIVANATRIESVIAKAVKTLQH